MVVSDRTGKGKSLLATWDLRQTDEHVGVHDLRATNVQGLSPPHQCSLCSRLMRGWIPSAPATKIRSDPEGEGGRDSDWEGREETDLIRNDVQPVRPPMHDAT
jgi:hypothetical protein